MIIEIKVPTLPESVADATIAAWRFKVGEPVARDDILVDVETDKIVLEVPAPDDGVLTEIRHQEGDTVQANQVVAMFEVGQQTSAAPATVTETETQAPAAPAAPAAASSASGEMMDIKVPALPESVSEATIALWRAKAGDVVKRDEILVDIETDKIVLEVPAPDDVQIVEIIAQEGATVLADAVIAKVQLGVSAASSAPSVAAPAAPAAPAEPPASSSHTEDLSPSVRRLVAEHSLDVTKIKGTGVGGRITKSDVEAHLGGGQTSSQNIASPAVSLSGRGEKRVPMTRLRKRIAQRLLEVKSSTAMLTTFNEVNMKPVMDLRKSYKDMFEKNHDVRLGFMSFYVKAVTEALKRFPQINASIDGDDIVYHNYFDISVAISTPRGLVTPVLRNCDQMSFAQIEQGIQEFADKGREGRLSLDELKGGNFTITNGGVFGSLMSTPIINPPQSAILGMHAIKDRPMAVNGEVVILPMMYLALSYDHRIVDGKESVSFLVAIKEMLEDPARMLLAI
tara:strand:- start:1930 stop:3459 length:1530 start_codon:yes stop_codon:yes gene_type:complete